MTRCRYLALLVAFALTAIPAARAQVARTQVEGPVRTQALVNVAAKSKPPAGASAVTVAVDGRKQPLSSWSPVVPADTQVALLIDDGLRQSVARELDNLRHFVSTLPPGVQVMVGYMQYGHVVPAQSFTTDHQLAASSVHLPVGMAGMSASPYICLSDFVKNWPSDSGASSSGGSPASSLHKARFILMLSDGVDPYNGSTSVMNQGSPYVDTAISDAQRAGVAVYAIYFGDTGLYGGMTNSSGQDYLNQVTQSTGGVNYWQGIGNPVSTAPFLAMFRHAIAETYVATFLAPAGNNPERDLVRIKFTAARTRLRAPERVLPGNRECPMPPRVKTKTSQQSVNVHVPDAVHSGSCGVETTASE